MGSTYKRESEKTILTMYFSTYFDIFHRMEKEKKNNWFSILILVLVVSGVYSTTVNRSIGYTDSGELAAVAYTLSIAHPTGYPLFTLLGRCVAMIPLSLRPITQLNIFGALLCIVALVVFYFTIRFILIKLKIDKELQLPLVNAISVSSTLILAFSSTVWLQSTNIEVYALHFLFLMILLYGTTRSLLATSGEKFSQWMCIVAYILGLSFGNHMTTILVVPALAYAILIESKKWNYNVKFYFTLLFLFILGLSVYLYLPIRAKHQPPLLWGNPVDVERFLWHVSGKQYQVWMFEGWSVAQKQLIRYITHFNDEFYFPLLFFLVFGLSPLLKQARTLGIALLLMFCTTVLYSINYSIFDIDPYFLLSYCAIALFLGVGIAKFFSILQRRFRVANALLFIIALSLPGIQVFTHYNHVLRNAKSKAETFTEETIRLLPHGAVVISGLWDYFVSPFLYLQEVEGKRKDLIVIDYHLLKNRSWYFAQLQQKAPWLMAMCSREVEEFLEELSKFEHNEPFHPNVIQSKWGNLLACFSQTAITTKSLFVDVRVHNDFPQNVQRIPWGTMIRLVSPNDTTREYYMSEHTGFVGPASTIVEHDMDLYRRTIFYWSENWLKGR